MYCLLYFETEGVSIEGWMYILSATTTNTECALNALAIDNPLEYARLYLDGTMQIWIDAEDFLEVW